MSKKSFLMVEDLPRGIRNNNPGNIRYSVENNWLGKIALENNVDEGKEFEQFDYIENGIRAHAKLIIQDVLAGKDTLRKLINYLSPESDGNHPTDYLLRIKNETGIDPDEILVLSVPVLVSVLRVMYEVENGLDSHELNGYITNQDIEEGIGFLPESLLQNLVAGVEKNPMVAIAFIAIVLWLLFGDE